MMTDKAAPPLSHGVIGRDRWIGNSIFFIGISNR